MKHTKYGKIHEIYENMGKLNILPFASDLCEGDLEGVFNMINVKVVFILIDNGDDVETNDSIDMIIFDIEIRRFNDMLYFTFVDSIFRFLQCVRFPGLYFTKHDYIIFHGYNIKFVPLVEVPVPVQNGVSFLCEHISGQFLSYYT